MFGSRNTCDDDAVLKRLKEVSFLKMFSNNLDVINKIACICTRKIFKAGSFLIKEGD